MNVSLHAPPFVNYQCQLCGWCCHQYDITFSDADFRRLSKHNWARLEPALAGKEWCAPLRGASGSNTYRLRCGPDGACVFLSPDNKCLMHRHVGELGKTLGCCVFPFTFATTPSGVYVGCRFSCAAVAYGLGEAVVRRERTLKEQYDLCNQAQHVPQYGEEVAFDGRRTLPWADYLKLDETLIRIFLRDDLPFVRRLFMASKLIAILHAAKLERLRGPKFAELMQILEGGLLHEAESESLPVEPGRLARMMFRQFCFLFTRRLGGAYRELPLTGKLKVRLRQFWTGVQFACNCSSAALPAFPGRVAIAEVARFRPRPLNADSERALSRFVAAKVFGKQYFGKLFFSYSWLDGINFLVLAAGAVMWYARAMALARGAGQVQTEDVIEAIRYVDFCYGFSRAPALIIERLRVRILSSGDKAARLALAQFA